MSEAKRYVVTAPYVTVKTMTTEGWRMIGLHEGAPLPPDVEQPVIDNLLRKNLIGEVGNLPVAAADRDAAEMAKFHDAQVVAAEFELEQARERLELHKQAAAASHKQADDAESAQADADKVKADAEQRLAEQQAAEQGNGESGDDKSGKPATSRRSAAAKG